MSEQRQVNPQIPYSNYQSKYRRHLGADYSQWKYENFTDLTTVDLLKHLFVKRNNRNGTQYRIIDIFGKDFLFYMAFLTDGEFTIRGSSGQYKYYLFGTSVNIDTSLMQKLFPRGIPQTQSQLNTWVNYLGFLAHQKFN